MNAVFRIYPETQSILIVLSNSDPRIPACSSNSMSRVCLTYRDRPRLSPENALQAVTDELSDRFRA
jgi:hypothetical protein